MNLKKLVQIPLGHIKLNHFLYFLLNKLFLIIFNIIIGNDIFKLIFYNLNLTKIR